MFFCLPPKANLGITRVVVLVLGFLLNLCIINSHHHAIPKYVYQHIYLSL